MKADRWRRVVLIVLDGVGIGALPDAERYGDVGADTLGHVADCCGGLSLPHLQRFGLGNIRPIRGVPPEGSSAAFGRMAERSAGKDTTTGHWELAGIIQKEPFATYPQGFPAEIIEGFIQAAGIEPIGNVAASGTEIIRRLGMEHLRTGRPIVYTSADSVFQIAAHEDVIPVERLYRICAKTRRMLDPYRIGRVIARPFVGSSAENFRRTSGRHDFSMPPTGKTVLDLLSAAGHAVHGIGKIHDIFCGRGITEHVTTAGNAEGMERTIEALGRLERGLIFTNLVDFDMLYGHRLDAAGFGKALEIFDAWLPRLVNHLDSSDLLLITADHGCDPTTAGTDHCREYVPLLAWHRGLQEGADLGTRDSFADVAATVAEALGVELAVGTSFLPEL